MVVMFTSQLELKVLGAQAYEVTQPLIYQTTGMTIQVGVGFDFDGASVPQCLWSFGFSPMTGGYQRSACLHDALYASEYFPREICDVLFLEAMESEGVGYMKRYSMYYAVRSFGWTVWRNHKKEEVNEYKKYVTFISKITRKNNE